MLIFKTLHIISMFTMVMGLIGGFSVYALAVGRRDIRALAAIHRTLARGRLAANVSAVALLAGVVFGLLTALTAGFDFLAGWLINAYVLVAAIAIFADWSGRRLRRLGDAAIDAEEGRRPTEEVMREVAASRFVRQVVIGAVLVVAIVADMVLKL